MTFFIINVLVAAILTSFITAAQQPRCRLEIEHTSVPELDFDERYCTSSDVGTHRILICLHLKLTLKKFEKYYTPLRDLLLTTALDGLDIDIEEEIPIETVTRLISRLRTDFGTNFLITLAPVASALIPNPFILEVLYPLNPQPKCSTAPSPVYPTLPNLSGFSYAELERSVYGAEIAWYNTQFYGGWGNALSTAWYDAVIEVGWSPERIVLAVLTDPQSGAGYVPIETLVNVSAALNEKYRGYNGGFGGVMGWEYVHSLSSRTHQEDSTEAILGSRDLVDVVEQALAGGVTIVQYRDKTSDTGALISIAKALHEKCKAHGIPLLINDRVDVALAVGCEGVHLGQDDMNVAEARRILGTSKIIGATVSSIDEARIAVERGADYLGIGTLYATNTKKNTKEIIGIPGIRKILSYLDQGNETERSVGTVCIGGVNASNVQRIKHQLLAPTPANAHPKTIDGVAVVSAIIGASDPQAASSHLSTLLTSSPPFALASTAPHFTHENPENEIASLLTKAAKCTKKVRETSPLSHNMTNLVVQNLAANVALAIGASPIMANYGAEAGDLSKLGGGLVINMGTVTPDGLTNYQAAIEAYNAAGGPIILDPVGAGATSVRREALTSLLGRGYFDLIKGNEKEILAVATASGIPISGATTQQRGVDSGTALFTLAQKASLVTHLAARERNVVLMTGATDVLSDGSRTYAISNGHGYLARVTGTGCTLGTTLSAYLASNPGDKLVAALAGVLHFEIAAEDAAERGDVRGAGTFVPAFIDELWNVGEGIGNGAVELARRAKVVCVRGVDGQGVFEEA
ncbi:TMP-TENI-domain-containing protein [Stemphylium lycopersici]|nr:TMP-TENI-domain-containing protein [Stemphylium lycopersici]